MTEEMSEKELMGLQMQGPVGERPEEKYGEYFRWANESDPGTTMNDDLFPGFRSKEITLANFKESEVEEARMLVKMGEWTKRMLNPSWNPSPGQGEEELGSINQELAMMGRISRGRHGFERKQQTKQVNERRVSTDTNTSKSLLSKLFPG